MTIIIDANIIFSIIINPASRFGDYYLTNPDDLIFIAPNYLRKEISKHQEKLLKITGFQSEELIELKELLYSRILFYSMEIIPEYIWNQATAIMENNDEKDIPYLAFSLFFGAKIWTGDNVFCNRLRSKGFNYCFSPLELM